MNKQMTPAEINVPVCGRPAMSVRERFIFNGLDKFDTLLGPNEAGSTHAKDAPTCALWSRSGSSPDLEALG